MTRPLALILTAAVLSVAQPAYASEPPCFDQPVAAQWTPTSFTTTPGYNIVVRGKRVTLTYPRGGMDHALVVWGLDGEVLYPPTKKYVAPEVVTEVTICGVG